MEFKVLLIIPADSSSLSCESLAKLMVDAYVTRVLATRIQGQALAKVQSVDVTVEGTHLFIIVTHLTRYM